MSPGIYTNARGSMNR